MKNPPTNLPLDDSSPRDVMWIPSPPKAGSASMDRYWRELVEIFAEEKKEEGSFSSFVTGPASTTRRAGRIARAYQRYWDYPLRAAFARKTDVFHLLDHSHAHLLPWLEGKGKRVVTVHDLVPLRDGTGLTNRQVSRFRQTVLHLREADLILSDSDFTAMDVRRLLGTDCPPVKTLLLGVDSRRFRQPVRDLRELGLNLPEGVPVCLCVGSDLPRKNMGILPALIGKVLEQVPELVVLKVGSHFDATTATRLRALEPKLRIVELPQATEEELVAAYQRADCLLFPSLLEGFGLPVLEAMAAGTPVVASEASSIPEVGLDAALYFEPHDAVTGARQVLRVLLDANLREELIQKGLARAAELDWSQHAIALQKIYRDVAAAPEKAPRHFSKGRDASRMRRVLNAAVVGIARVLGSPLKDVDTGESLGRALLIPWRGRIHVIGLNIPVRAVFLTQKRVTYWKQEIGFTTHPKPDFPYEQNP